MDDALYLKFVQHPNIRAELMATAYAPLLDGNEPRRLDAEGVNELGKVTRLPVDMAASWILNRK